MSVICFDYAYSPTHFLVFQQLRSLIAGRGFRFVDQEPCVLAQRIRAWLRYLPGYLGHLSHSPHFGQPHCQTQHHVGYVTHRMARSIKCPYYSLLHGNGTYIRNHVMMMRPPRRRVTSLYSQGYGLYQSADLYWRSVQINVGGTEWENKVPSRFHLWFDLVRWP